MGTDPAKRYENQWRVLEGGWHLDVQKYSERIQVFAWFTGSTTVQLPMLAMDGVIETGPAGTDMARKRVLALTQIAPKGDYGDIWYMDEVKSNAWTALFRKVQRNVNVQGFVIHDPPSHGIPMMLLGYGIAQLKTVQHDNRIRGCSQEWIIDDPMDTLVVPIRNPPALKVVADPTSQSSHVDARGGIMRYLGYE